MRTAVWERIWWVYASQRCVWLAKLVIVLGGFRWAKFAKVSLVRSRRNQHHLSVRIRENPSNQSIIWLRHCLKRTLISLVSALQCKPPPLPTEAAAPSPLLPPSLFHSHLTSDQSIFLPNPTPPPRLIIQPSHPSPSWSTTRLIGDPRQWRYTSACSEEI
jgi:hypothetical protein